MAKIKHSVGAFSIQSGTIKIIEGVENDRGIFAVMADVIGIFCFAHRAFCTGCNFLTKFRELHHQTKATTYTKALFPDSAYMPVPINYPAPEIGMRRNFLNGRNMAFVRDNAILTNDIGKPVRVDNDRVGPTIIDRFVRNGRGHKSPWRTNRDFMPGFQKVPEFSYMATVDCRELYFQRMAHAVLNTPICHQKSKPVSGLWRHYVKGKLINATAACRAGWNMACRAGPNDPRLSAIVSGVCNFEVADFAAVHFSATGGNDFPYARIADAKVGGKDAIFFSRFVAADYLVYLIWAQNVARKALAVIWNHVFIPLTYISYGRFHYNSQGAF